MKSYERFDLTKNVSNLPTVLVYESLRKQHKYLEVPSLGTSIDLLTHIFHHCFGKK